MSDNLEPETANRPESNKAVLIIRGKLYFRKVARRLNEILHLLSLRFAPIAERIRSAIKLKPRVVYGCALGVVVLMLLGLALPQTLTAALRIALPERIVGIESDTAAADRGAIEAYLGAYGDATTKLQETALYDASRKGYLPDTLRSETPVAQSIITIPASQGRLLRFDEAVESVFIADPEIADIRMVSSDLVYVYGKSLGVTNLMAISGRSSNGSNGSGVKQQVTASALLRIVAETRPAEEALHQWAPESPVEITMFGRRTAFKGQVANIDEAVNAANVAETYSAKDQPPLNKTTLSSSNQINIRVRFAEVSRNDLKSFGIDWDIAAGGGNFSFGLATQGQTQDPNIGLSVGGGNFDIELLIEALQANGALTVLAEPNLTAVTGETANFLAGGEVPIPVPTGRGEDSITVQYKPFGVSLYFTPTIVSGNRIAMRVKPEVSSIASNTSFAVEGFNLPTFTVRRAETTVEMASGQTFAMAGLFQREISRNVDKLPVLGDVPVLGPLFRSERYQRNETELVILITPYLVNPVSDGSFATPLDRSGPTEWQADIIAPDQTSKGAAFAEPDGQSGFILK